MQNPKSDKRQVHCDECNEASDERNKGNKSSTSSFESRERSTFPDRLRRCRAQPKGVPDPIHRKVVNNKQNEQHKEAVEPPAHWVEVQRHNVLVQSQEQPHRWKCDKLLSRPFSTSLLQGEDAEHGMILVHVDWNCDFLCPHILHSFVEIRHHAPQD